MIYLDSASTTYYKDPSVYEAALRPLANPYRSASPVAVEAMEVLEGCRRKIAKFIAAPDPKCCAFCAGATQGLNLILDALLHDKSHVITSSMEHNSVLRPLARLHQQRGIEVSKIPLDRDGRLCLDEIPKLLRPSTEALVINHVSNLTGLINPLETLSAFARKNSLLLIVDAAQSIGHLPIDVNAIGIDALAFSGHKGLGSLMGVGMIYVRKGLNLRPVYSGGTGSQTFDEFITEMPSCFEAGSLNLPGIASLEAALDHFDPSASKRALELRQLACRELEQMPDYRIYGPGSKDRDLVAILAFNHRYLDANELEDELGLRIGLAARSGNHCAPDLHHHFQTEKQGILRLSFCGQNTTDELKQLIDALHEIAAEMRLS
ncbi:MAG: aminotransferase class V-fold PLP-dependent enzyme [Eubacteriales bacterium]|nr:aminotransferase class V-fold PLP-dependent enzyme [Eubacteriales bacterium]